MTATGNGPGRAERESAAQDAITDGATGTPDATADGATGTPDATADGAEGTPDAIADGAASASDDVDEGEATGPDGDTYDGGSSDGGSSDGGSDDVGAAPAVDGDTDDGGWSGGGSDDVVAAALVSADPPDVVGEAPATVRVLRGDPNDDELAALVAGIVAARGVHDEPEEPTGRAPWSDHARPLRLPPAPGTDTWRWSLQR